MSIVLIVSATHGTVARGQSPDRFWLAGRYDRNRVIVYFDAVKFKDADTAVKTNIPAPQADGFFGPGRLSPEFVARFESAPDAERFSLGDRYDLLLDSDVVATVTLTTLVGATTDEQVGNDSYIGALATLSNRDLQSFTKSYYVVRRHEEHNDATAPSTRSSQRSPATSVGLSETPPAAPLERIAPLIHDALARDTLDAIRANAAQLPVKILGVQAFRTGEGDVRYYVRAKLTSDTVCTRVSAWMAPSPKPRVLALETGSCRYDMMKDDPPLLNVVDLGGGRIGLIVLFQGGDGIELRLVEYRDGETLSQMRKLQSISAGE